VNAIVDTVVWRILDQLGLPNPGAYRWAEKSGSPKKSRKKN
jgi:3-polyprenyl-4-hydroxybenzoate decarboxylase